MSAQWPFMSWPINAFHPGNPIVKDLVTTTHTHTKETQNGRKIQIQTLCRPVNRFVQAI